MSVCTPISSPTPIQHNCCTGDDALVDQLKRVFQVPSGAQCMQPPYYLTWNCDGFQNQSITDLVTLLVSGGVTINVSPIQLQCAPNISDSALPCGIKITQAGPIYTLQLNTFGLAGGSSLTGVNGLFTTSTSVGLGGKIDPGQFWLVDGGLDTHITWGSTGANPITDFWIAADCIQLNTKDNGSDLNCDDKVLVGGMNNCVEWKVYKCPAFSGVENGLVASGSNAQMGGTFNQPSTTIDGLGNSFSITNLLNHEIQTTNYKVKVGGTYGAPGQVLMVSGSQQLIYQNIPVVPPLVYSGINGITVVGTNITLGGTLSDALIEIDGQTTKSLRFKDIQTLELIAQTPKFSSNGSFGNAGEVPIATGAGNWQWGPIVLPPGIVTADNGLTAAGNNVKLGGTLIDGAGTAILGAGKYFHFNGLGGFKVETTTLQLNIAASTGAANYVLTADGAGYYTWQAPTAGGFSLNRVLTSANPYVAAVSDGIIYLTAIDQVVELPAVVDKAILYIVPKNTGLLNQIKPNGLEELYDGGNPVYTAASPYTIPLNQPTAIQGVDDGVNKFWQIISKA